MGRIRGTITCQKGRCIAWETTDGRYEHDGVALRVTEREVKKRCRLAEISLSMSNEACRENQNLSMEEPVRLYMELEEIPKKITALYMFSEWWSRPAFADKFSDVPERTQVALFQYPDRFACLVPAVGTKFKTTMAPGTESEICLVMSAGVGGMQSIEEPLYVLADGDTVEEAVHRAFAWLAKYKGIRMRGERRLPELFSYLGWCSWNACYRDITEDVVRQKADELSAKKVPVRWMLMDDGWFPVKEEKIWDFRPETEKFPNGFRKMIDGIKEDGIVRWFGVWHALGGFWGGVHPDSRLAQTERDFLYATKNGKLVPGPQNGEGFFNDWYELLRAEGIDFVKVDGQSALAYYIENDFPIGSAAKEMHRGLEGAASCMDGIIINCMGMAMENILSRPTSAVNRNSDDFFPDIEGSFKEHLLQNAYNAIYQDELYYCDWDMFWTEHEAAKKHSLLRAISGGPIYVSDKVGHTEPKVLRPLCYLDGQLLSMDRAAKPTEDCMFNDPFAQGVLKLQNTAPWGTPASAAGESGHAGGIAVYNLTDTKQQFTLCPAQIRGIEKADHYWVYDYFHKKLYRRGSKEVIEGALDTDGFGWYVILPQRTMITPLGLLDKYAGFSAVEASYGTERMQTFVVHETGTFGFIAAQEIALVTKNGVDVTDRVSVLVGESDGTFGRLYKLSLSEEAVGMVVTVALRESFS